MASISGSNESAKDKKIIDLAKRNRDLQQQVESLKNKAAKAAEIAIKLSKEKEHSEQSSPAKQPLP